MKYNTTRSALHFREYGRHVQQLVEHAETVQDKEERNNIVNQIIRIMGSLAPQLKSMEDFKYKLYNHLNIMSDYKLDFESPYELPTKKEADAKPEPLHYPKSRIRFRHYGKYVKGMIDKATAEQDPEKKKEFTTCIANYMKMVHQNWNHENVTDEVIEADLEMLSDHQLKLDESASLGNFSSNKSKSSNKRRRGKSNNRSGGGKRRNYPKNYR